MLDLKRGVLLLSWWAFKPLIPPAHISANVGLLFLLSVEEWMVWATIILKTKFLSVNRQDIWNKAAHMAQDKMRENCG